MYNSILNSMKKMLGLTPDYEPLDVENAPYSYIETTEKIVDEE